MKKQLQISVFIIGLLFNYQIHAQKLKSGTYVLSNGEGADYVVQNSLEEISLSNSTKRYNTLYIKVGENMYRLSKGNKVVMLEIKSNERFILFAQNNPSRTEELIWFSPNDELIPAYDCQLPLEYMEVITNSNLSQVGPNSSLYQCATLAWYHCEIPDMDALHNLTIKIVENIKNSLQNCDCPELIPKSYWEGNPNINDLKRYTSGRRADLDYEEYDTNNPNSGGGYQFATGTGSKTKSPKDLLNDELKKSLVDLGLLDQGLMDLLDGRDLTEKKSTGENILNSLDDALSLTDFSSANATEELIGATAGGLLGRMLVQDDEKTEEEIKLEKEKRELKKTEFKQNLAKLEEKTLQGDNNALNLFLDDYTYSNSEYYDFDFSTDLRNQLITLASLKNDSPMLQSKALSLLVKENANINMGKKIELLIKSINVYKESGSSSFDGSLYGYLNDPIDKLYNFSLQEDYEKFKIAYNNNLTLVDGKDNIITKRFLEYNIMTTPQLNSIYKEANKKRKKLRNLPLKVLVGGIITGAAMYFAGNSQTTKALDEKSVDNYNKGLFLKDAGRNLAIGSVLGAGITIPLKNKQQRKIEKRINYIENFLIQE